MKSNQLGGELHGANNNSSNRASSNENRRRSPQNAQNGSVSGSSSGATSSNQSLSSLPGYMQGLSVASINSMTTVNTSPALVVNGNGGTSSLSSQQQNYHQLMHDLQMMQQQHQRQQQPAGAQVSQPVKKSSTSTPASSSSSSSASSTTSSEEVQTAVLNINTIMNMFNKENTNGSQQPVNLNQFQNGLLNAVAAVAAAVAQNGAPVSLPTVKSNSSLIDMVSNETMDGSIAIVSSMNTLYNGNSADVASRFDGRINYQRNGETFYIPYSVSDVAKNTPLKVGDRIRFCIARDSQSGTCYACQINLAPASSPRLG